MTHGFDPGAQPELVMSDAQFVRAIRTAQLERILIDLSATGHGDATYRGCSLDGDRLRGLPVGSTLDATTGHFAWAVGLGFGGAHELLFVRTGAYGSAQGPRPSRNRRAVTPRQESTTRRHREHGVLCSSTLRQERPSCAIGGWLWLVPVNMRLSSCSCGPACGSERIRMSVEIAARPARFAPSGFSDRGRRPRAGVCDVIVYAHSTATHSLVVG